MKLNYLFLLAAFAALVTFGEMQTTNAQSELVVQWETTPGSGIPLKNALRDAILADSLRPPDRVYKLLRGGFYWDIDRINNSGFHLRIVGEEGDPNISFENGGNPPVIQRVYDDPGTFVDDKLIVGDGDLTLKNVYIIHCDDLGAQNAYQPIELSGTGRHYTFDNVIFERSNFATVAVTNPGNTLTFTNCIFRNLIGEPSTQQWEGRGMSLWIDQDSVIVENCTFFNVEFTPFQLEGGAANYIRYNHNTLVNIGRQMAIDGHDWIEAYFANSLIVNAFWHGEGYSDISNPNRDPRAYNTGIFQILDMPSKYGPEETRRILLANVAAYRDPLFSAYYADTIRSQPFCNPITKEDYLDVYDQMVALDTMWLTNVPGGLGTYFTQSFIVDSMIQNIKDIRAGVTPAHPWFWWLPRNPGGDVCFVCPSWYGNGTPRGVPEDFTYTDANLLTAGTDDLPIGDLNWFPTQKADFETNKATYITQLEQLAGQEIVYPVIDEAEGEDGTLGGTSTIEQFQGFAYIQMDGGGFFEWIFDCPTAGEYDLNVWTHMRGNAQRGQHHFINGVEIHDVAHGWGELIYDNAAGCTNGMPIDEWTWVRWEQSCLIEAGALTFPAGQCTIKVSSSWGWQNFAGMDLINPVTQDTVVKLRVPDLTSYDVVQLKAEGAAYVPRGFKTVQLGANGDITWNFNAPTPGNYGLVINYQAPAGTQSLTLDMNGSTTPVTLEGVVGDSSGLGTLTSRLNIPSAGQVTTKVTGSNILLDWVQFVREDVTTSVIEQTGPPKGFALLQNYPNPFNPSTTINFTIAEPKDVKLIIYDILGQNVTTLVNEFLNAGSYKVQFDAGRLASGVYFYSIKAGDFISVKKMMLLK